MKSEKKLQQFIKKIEKTNKIFNESTKAQKRVMIAQDCIDRIKCNLLTASTGSFITYNGWEVDQKLVNTTTCQVCAKGGLFASYIGRVNNFRDECLGNDERNEAHKKLREVFTLRQLAIIEYAFEGSQYIYSVSLTPDMENKLEDFYDENYEDDDQRLIKICENIIKNKGTFKL